MFNSWNELITAKFNEKQLIRYGFRIPLKYFYKKDIIEANNSYVTWLV